jgi:predicted HTH transcriptional regulator
MAENQNIEYKQSWHDNYLKWICGLANARGGRIYIGKDDDGRVTGLDAVALRRHHVSRPRRLLLMYVSKQVISTLEDAVRLRSLTPVKMRVCRNRICGFI